jgi:TIGR03009 family protein
MLLNSPTQNGAFVSQQFVSQAVSTHRRPHDATLPVTSTLLQYFICRTERILAQMPSHKQFAWVRLCVCLLAGSWCAAALAQTPVQAKRYPSSQSTTAKRPPVRQVQEEEPEPVTAGRAAPRTRISRPADQGEQPAGAGRAALQPGRAAMQQNQPARPEGQVLRIPAVTPELDAILKEWEAKSAAVKRLEGKFERITYDDTFNVQKVATGKYCFQFPDKGSLHQTGKEVPAGTLGSQPPNRKEPYIVKSGTNERWICDGEKIFKFDDSKVYEEIEIPPTDRGQNIRNAPLPFVFGMKAVEAKQRYQFILNEKGTNESQIRVLVIPLMQQDQSNYKQADVILDRTTCLPLAVQLTSPTGESRDVYKFERASRVVNRSAWGTLFAGDPLKPNLKGYKKRVIHEEGARLANQQLDDADSAPPKVGPKPLVPREKYKKTVEVIDEEAVAPPKKKSSSRIN